MPSKSSIFLSISSLLLRPRNLSTLSTNDLGCLESSIGLSSTSPLTVGSSNSFSSADILSICSVISVSLLRVSSRSCSSALFLNLANADGFSFFAFSSANRLLDANLSSSILSASSRPNWRFPFLYARSLSFLRSASFLSLIFFSLLILASISAMNFSLASAASCFLVFFLAGAGAGAGAACVGVFEDTPLPLLDGGAGTTTSSSTSGATAAASSSTTSSNANPSSANNCSNVSSSC